jgi:hypothetical protein
MRELKLSIQHRRHPTADKTTNRTKNKEKQQKTKTEEKEI